MWPLGISEHVTRHLEWARGEGDPEEGGKKCTPRIYLDLWNGGRDREIQHQVVCFRAGH